jgi:ATP-dependent Lhr-like helicase
LLELVRLHQLIATVKPCARSKARGEIPVWAGSKMPLSTELSKAVARRLDEDAKLTPRPETEAINDLLRIQRAWSEVPNDRILQIEHARSRQGEHLFFYTFAGRMANEGLGALFAHRLSEGSPQSIQVTQNDYGFSLTSSRPLPLDESRLDRIRAAMAAEALAIVNDLSPEDCCHGRIVQANYAVDPVCGIGLVVEIHGLVDQEARVFLT